MQDFFGYNKEVRSTNQLASSEFALMTVGSAQSLLQQVQANYAQELRPIYEIGSPAVYWVGGHASGQIQVSRLVGNSGFLGTLGSVAGNCGKINPVRIQFSGAGACYASVSGGLLFDGAILESVTFSLDAGRVEVVEGFNLRVSNLSKS
jgi:hypothetical protein